MRLEYYALEFNPDILGEGQPDKRNGLGAQGLLTTRTNINSKQSINRRTVPNRVVSRTFQKLKVKRSMISKVQPAQQVTNIELLFDLCLRSNFSRIDSRPNHLATYRDRCWSYSCIYQGRPGT
jgi:hypothetical protein